MAIGQGVQSAGGHEIDKPSVVFGPGRVFDQANQLPGRVKNPSSRLLKLGNDETSAADPNGFGQHLPTLDFRMLVQRQDESCGIEAGVLKGQL